MAILQSASNPPNCGPRKIQVGICVPFISDCDSYNLLVRAVPACCNILLLLSWILFWPEPPDEGGFGWDQDVRTDIFLVFSNHYNFTYSVNSGLTQVRFFCNACTF